MLYNTWVLVTATTWVDIELFEECVKKEPQNATFQYHLGMSYYKSGNKEKAKEVLSRAVNLDPKLPEIKEVAGILARLGA